MKRELHILDRGETLDPQHKGIEALVSELPQRVREVSEPDGDTGTTLGHLFWKR